MTGLNGFGRKESTPAPTVARISSGVRVVVDPMPWLSTAAIGVWVDAGARDETPDEAGAAHLIEHMAFKGAGARDARQIVDAIESVGGWINAETTHERTSFFVRCLSDDLPLAVEVLRDIVLSPRFDPADLALERNVVAQEIAEAADDPEDLAFDRLQEAAFEGSSLSRPILGQLDTVRSQTVSGLKAFHAAGYRPDGIVVAAAGGINPARFRDLAEAAFGAAQPGADRRLREPAGFRPGARFVERDFDQAHLALAFEGFAGPDGSSIAMRAFAEILGGGMASRLFQELREQRGLAYTIDAAVDAYDDVGAVTVYAGVDRKNAREAVSRILSVVAGIAGGVTEAEVSRAKAVLKAGALMAMEQPQARAETAAAQIYRYGTTRPLAETVARIDAVTTADVRVAATRAVERRPAFAGVGRIGRKAIQQALSEDAGVA